MIRFILVLSSELHFATQLSMSLKIKVAQNTLLLNHLKVVEFEGLFKNNATVTLKKNFIDTYGDHPLCTKEYEK